MFSFAIISRYVIAALCAVVMVPVYGSDMSLTMPEGALLSSGLDPTFVAHFALFIAVLLLWTVCMGKLFKLLFRLPVVAGQILGGVLMGPSLLNIKGWHCFSEPLLLFDRASNTFYALLSADIFVFFVLLLSAAFTVSYLMWIAGHETDIKDILKVGVTALTAGIFGAFFPVILTVAALWYICPGYFSFIQSMGVGLVLSATSVSIPVAMLFSRKKMHLRSSKATLGAAIIDDIVAVIALSLFFISLESGLLPGAPAHALTGTHQSLTSALVYMVVSFLVIAFTGYFLIPSLMRFLKRQHYSHLIASFANGIMLLYFAFAEIVGGLAGITGAYFAGLFHRMGDKRHTAEKVISPFVNAVLLPLFLGSIGLQVNLRVLNADQWGIVLLLLIVAILSKLGGCYMATLMSNIFNRKSAYRWTSLESFLFGSSMVARGEVGLVIITILNGKSIITPDQYVMAVVVIVLTTIASPVMLSLGFNMLDKKSSPERANRDYHLNIGLFNVIGTTQMFNIIVGRIESLKAYKTTIRYSEGRRMVNLEGQGVKLILCPDEGIMLKGDQQKIEEIMSIVKSAMMEEVASIAG